MPDVPCVACTATATQRVIADIRECLSLQEDICPLHIATFNRPNVNYEVRYKSSLEVSRPMGAEGDLVDLVKMQHALALASGEPCAGIVYAHKRSDTESLARRINQEAGVRAAPYHAGLASGKRSEVQRMWTSGEVQVAVATVAFGMGIDLAHVRYVVHWAMAKTVEGFYQESGRGGRDGKSALSVLYYSKEDASKFSFIMRKEMEGKARKRGIDPSVAALEDDRSLTALQGMVDYCVKSGCRRKYLLRHFGETIDPAVVCQKTCDYCRNPRKVESAIEAANIARDVAAMVKRSAPLSKSLHAKQEWDGQWRGPHGDDGEEKSDIQFNDDFIGDWDDSDCNAVGVGGCATEDQSRIRPEISSRKNSNSFIKANRASTLQGKFETREVSTGRTTGRGFVNFRAKNTEMDLNSRRDEIREKTCIVTVPEHLRKGLPDPLASYSIVGNKSQNEGKGSSELRSDVERLKAGKSFCDNQTSANVFRLIFLILAPCLKVSIITRRLRGWSNLSLSLSLDASFPAELGLSYVLTPFLTKI